MIIHFYFFLRRSDNHSSPFLSILQSDEEEEEEEEEEEAVEHQAGTSAAAEAAAEAIPAVAETASEFEFQAPSAPSPVKEAIPAEIVELNFSSSEEMAGIEEK